VIVERGRCTQVNRRIFPPPQVTVHDEWCLSWCVAVLPRSDLRLSLGTGEIVDAFLMDFWCRTDGHSGLGVSLASAIVPEMVACAAVRGARWPTLWPARPAWSVWVFPSS